MGFISSLFSGSRRDESTHSDSRTDSDSRAQSVEDALKGISELYEGMTLDVFMENGDPLLTGCVASFTNNSLSMERLPGGLSFQVCELGSTVSIRGCNRKMMQFTLQATVQEASRVAYKFTNLRLDTHEELRNNFRLILNTPISLYYQEDVHFTNPEECTLVNISIGGVCVQSEFLHGEGEVLRMKVKLEEYAPMEFLGEVVRVSEPKHGIYQYGILFAQLTKDETESLTRTLYNLQRGNRDLFYRHGYGHW